MSKVHSTTWHAMSHITGPSAVWVSLRFGVMPDSGPLVMKVLGLHATSGAMSFDLERHTREILEGVEAANATLGGLLQVEAIQVRPDDYPSPGQAKYVAYKIAEHVIAGSDATSVEPAPPAH